MGFYACMHVIYGLIWWERGGILDFNLLLSQKRLANAGIPYYNTGLEFYGVL
jgi:hypothetical protein